MPDIASSGATSSETVSESFALSSAGPSNTIPSLAISSRTAEPNVTASNAGKSSLPIRVF